MKRFLGFSLVELMISLIVISIVTAAFAPLVTKKLKTSDMSVGSSSSDYIFDETICNNSVSNCSVCVKDECVRCKTGFYLEDEICKICSNNCSKCDSQSGCKECEQGYYLEGVQCKACSAGCTSCTSLSDCSNCKDGFLKTGSSCTKCPNHCFDCTNSTECKTCSSGYFLTANKTCYKYDCSGDYFCLLTNDRDNVLSVYKYNFGDNPAFSITPDLGIKTCYMGDTKCAYGGTTPTCWLPNMLTGNYASTVATCATASKAQNYDRCNRVACNFHAYIKVAQKYKTSGLRFANYSDMNELKNLFFGNRAFEQTGAPFLVGITNDNSTIVTRATHQCYNQGMNDEPCWIAHRICFSSDGGAHYALFREPTARDKWAFNNPIPVWAYGLDDSYNIDLSTYKGYAEGALFVK